MNKKIVILVSIYHSFLKIKQCVNKIYDESHVKPGSKLTHERL